MRNWRRNALERVQMRNTLKTGEDENHTQNEWRWDLHPERVEMSITLGTSEDEYYSQNEWR